MKKITIILTCLILFVIKNGFAQKFNSGTIYLKSGQLTLDAGRIPEGDELAASAFNGRYYLMVQLKETITETTAGQLTKLGVEFLEYIPNKAYLVSLPQTIIFADLLAAGVYSISPLRAEWKTVAALHPFIQPIPPASGQRIRLCVSWYRNITALQVQSEMITLAGVTILSINPEFHRMVVDIDVAAIKSLILNPWVLWAEEEAPDMMEMNLPGKTLTRSSMIGSSVPGARNLNGSGVIVGIWDGGDCGKHVDFTGRETNIETSSLSQHATHVTGTIGGGGLKDQDMTGMAPKATLLNWNFTGDIPGEMGGALNSQNIVITNNSYSYSMDPCSTRGTYDQRSQDLDVLVNNSPFLTHVFAAGNFQTDNCAGSGANAGFRTVHSGSQATKNAIAVGAVDRLDAMSSFSAWGPLRDNRLKPEVVAVGVAVSSTNDANLYASSQGTSMATPNVSGIVAQLYQRFRQLNANQNPDATLIRAVLANSAEDLGNAGPDFKFGFGRVNALRAVRALEDGRHYNDTIRPGSAGRNKQIIVPMNCKRLKVMITWNDPAGSTTASPALVNDLDLTLYDKFGQPYLPWVLSALANTYNNAAVRGRDSLNNIEQVTIDNPTAGAWIIKVSGAVNLGNSQKFFVTYEFDTSSLEMIYPNGGETFVPGATEILRWDARFITGNVQLQYSTDGGSNWINISSSIAPTTQYYSWTVPSIPSGKAMVRVRTADSSISSTSDTTFVILGIAGGLQARACSNQIHLTWGNVTGAIGFEPLLMVNGDYVAKGITSTTSRFFTFTGLTNNTEYWVTVRPIIGTDSVRGKRSIALNATPTSTNIAPVFNTNLPIISSVCQGGNIVLRTQTAGAPTLTRQWQRSINNGSSWSTVTGTTDSLALTGVTAGMDKYLYRMNLTSSTCGNTITSVITALRVDTGLTITRVPVNNEACHNSAVQFNYASTSKSLPLTRWQFSANGGQSWNMIGDPVFDTLIVFNAPDTMNNYLVRAIASNGCDAGDTTTSASLFVKQRLKVNISNDTFICFRSLVNLTATATSGSPVTYTWEGMGNNSSYSVQPNATSVYKIAVSDSCGENFSDSVLVAVMVIDSSWIHNSTGQTLVNFNATEASALSYTWDFGDGTTAGTKSATHFYNANGNYKVCLTLTKGTCSTAKCNQITVTATGNVQLPDLIKLVTVYPNPAKIEISISSPVAIQQIEITDQLGKIIQTLKVNGSQNITIPLNELTPAIYMVNILGEAGTVHKKISIIR